MSRSSSSPLKPKTFAKAKPALKPKLKPKASKIPTLQANRASSKAQTASKKTPTARKVTDSPLRERAKVNTGGDRRCNGTARTAGVSLAEGLNETASGRERAKLDPLAPSTPRAPSKQAQLIELLGSVSGGSMAHMIALTGWQAHTVRGAISGALRKRLGLNVQSHVEDGVRLYRICKAGEVAGK